MRLAGIPLGVGGIGRSSLAWSELIFFKKVGLFGTFFVWNVLCKILCAEVGGTSWKTCSGAGKIGRNSTGIE